MKEWVRCLLFVIGMIMVNLLIRFLLHGTLKPWDDTLVFALCGSLPGLGVYYGDRIRRKNKVYQEKIKKYLNKDNYGL